MDDTTQARAAGPLHRWYECRWRPDGTTEGDGRWAEAGFTLIELMVVLLIMAILLAIAIPTFLSVTNGAKRTATQSDLTNTLISATALYTENTALTTTGPLVTALHRTQTTITYLPGTTAPAAGKNSVSVDDVTGSMAVFTAIDGAHGCWMAADNQSSGPLHGVPAGDSFGGQVLGTTATLSRCTAGQVGGHLTKVAWKPNFATVSHDVP